MSDSSLEVVAIISDVHGNTEALRAVLADMDALGVRDLVVAGDVIGFGPEPDVVVDTLRERGARMIRGNHERDYAALYGTPAMPAEWATSRRLISFRWSMARVGEERRVLLSALPDRLELDEETVVLHGSPRAVRDAVFPWTPAAELETMYAGERCRFAFMGHTHRPVVHELASRRLVNVGSVGMPLDGDPRACYVIAARTRDGWELDTRRVAYDVEASLAAFDGELRADDPGYIEIISRELRNARDYFGPWLRYSKDIPEAELDGALWRFLDEHP